MHINRYLPYTVCLAFSSPLARLDMPRPLARGIHILHIFVLIRRLKIGVVIKLRVTPILEVVIDNNFGQSDSWDKLYGVSHTEFHKAVFRSYTELR